MEPAKKLSPAIRAVIVIALISLVIGIIVIVNTDRSAPQTSDTDTGSSKQTSSVTTSNAKHTYKDGTYTKTGTYLTPGGREAIDLTVTLASNVITSTNLEQKAVSGEAKQYQSVFTSGYKDLVVGKNIDDVSLSRVAGSSLTSNGFNTALELIKSDAGV